MIPIIFPHYSGNDGELHDGQLFKAHPFCLEHFGSRICKNFYTRIKGDIGFHECPHGYTVFYPNDYEGIFITSILVRDYFNRKSVHKKKASIFSPIIDKDTLEKFITNLQTRHSGLRSFKDALHDVRKLNADIKSIAERMVDAAHFDMEDVKRILGCSGLLTTNLDIFDLDVNPNLLGIGTSQTVHLYKIFDKTLKCLKYRFSEKSITTNLYGRSDYKKKLPKLFVTIPFIILENAVKYTENNGIVNIIFEETADDLSISIECIDSPQVLDDEGDDIFKDGYRGKCIRKNQSARGQGKGLFFLARVCRWADVKYSAKSGEFNNNYHNGIPYCKFTLSLKFTKD